MKVFSATDPALYMPHVTTFINFDQGDEIGLRTSPDAHVLLLARAWGICKEPILKVLEARKRWSERRANNQEVEDPAAAMAKVLASIAPDNPALEQWKKIQEQESRPPGEESIARITELLGNKTPGREDPPPRHLVEHIAFHDTLQLTDVSTVAGWMRHRRDETGARRVEGALDLAKESMGIAGAVVASDFPIALCAVGYTRVSRSPNQSVFTPFPVDERGRIPLYVIAAETEGIALQLDPMWTARWLVGNGFISTALPEAGEEAWAWLYRLLPGLWQARWAPDYNVAPVVAVRTLLHSMSHVFLRRIEWSGFTPASVGEYLTPGTLSFVLFANRYADSKIGGLITLFEQQFDSWLWDALQSGRECTYDPLCADEGSSCAGCLYREFNCPEFNNELSRAVLYGGKTPQPGALAGWEIQHGFWDAAKEALLHRES